MAHHETVRLHGVQVVGGVQQRLALLQARGSRLQVHGVRAEARGGRAETQARARGVLEKGQHHGFAAQRGELLQRVALDFLEWLGLIENESEFVRGERLKGEQITKAIGHIWAQMITRRASERRGVLRPFLNLILRGPASRRKNFAGVSKTPRGPQESRALRCRSPASEPQLSRCRSSGCRGPRTAPRWAFRGAHGQSARTRKLVWGGQDRTGHSWPRGPCARCKARRQQEPGPGCPRGMKYARTAALPGARPSTDRLGIT